MRRILIKPERDECELGYVMSRSLPPGMPAPPSYNKSNPSDFPVLFLTLNSTTLPLSQVDRYAETVLAQRLSMVTGVAQVNVFGAQKYAVRVDVDQHPDLAQRYGSSAIPRFVVVGSDGEIVKAAEGALSPGEFIAWLKG